MTIILGIKLNQRQETSREFQEILTQFGCSIRTRIGLHRIELFNCAESGIILLEIINDEVIERLEKKLLTIDEIEIQKMVF